MNVDIQQIIVRVLQESVSEEELIVFSKWFYASKENKSLFFQLKNIYDHRHGGIVPHDTEINSSWECLLEKLKNNSLAATKSKKPTRSIVFYWQIASAIALLVMVMFIWTYTNHKSRTEWVEVRTTPHSQHERIKLPDGSFVELNASSSLKYPKKFVSESREVYLDGEALFDIVTQNGKSFVVRSHRQLIHVLGTKFNVTDYSNDNYSITTLVRGKVQLQILGDNNESQDKIVLQPNQQLIFNKKSNESVLTTVNTDDVTSWTTGVYSFQNESLEHIVNRLEKLYGITIIIPNETIKQKKYTGKFSSQQNINEIIQIINFKEQFDSRFRNDTIVLSKK